MRLSELSPQWEGLNHHRDRLSFDCPTCRPTHRITVDTRSTGLLAPDAKGRTWQLMRFTEEWDITLFPSIDSPCGWHGFVTRGEVTPDALTSAQEAPESASI